MQCAAHYHCRRATLFLLVAIITIGFSLGEIASSRVVAQTPDKAVDAPNPKSANATSKAAQSQDLDDPATPFDPKKPRSEAEKKRLDAISWYLAGRIKESRNDFKGAYEDFKKAVELDPTAIKVYRELVPLAFRLNRRDDAVKFAFKAVKLDPDDYQLLRRLGIFLAAQRQIPKAIELMEQAVQSKRIDKMSGDFVTLNRDLGILYGAIGNKDKAATAYEVVFDALAHPKKYKLDQRTRASLQIDPNTSYERLGQIFLNANKTDLAIKAFEQAAKDARGKPGNLSYNLARVYFQTGKHDEALTQLQKYFDGQLQSKGRAAYVLLADILKATKKSDELIGRLETLAKKDARNALLQLFLADQYLAAKRLDDAEAMYKTALKSSTEMSGYLGLAAVYRQQKRPAELIQALAKGFGGTRSPEQLAANLGKLETEMKAIQEDEKLLDSLIAAGREMSKGDNPKLDFNGSFILGKLAGDAKKIDAAVELYRFALKARADRAGAVYSELGSLLLENEKYGQAAEVFDEASTEPALAGQWPMFLYRLSQAHEMNGQTKKAITAIREARQGLPDNPLLHYQEGWIFYHAENWDEAIPLFEEIIENYNKQPAAKPTVRRAQFSLSNIYVQQGDFPKGEAILEKILEEDPEDPSVNNDLGYLWADRGKNLERAEKMIRIAIKAEPENAAYLDSMGWVLFKLGKFKEAIPHLEKAVSLPGGGDATIWDHLGDCYDRAGQADKAKDAWQKALDDAKKQKKPDEKIIKSIEEKLNPKPADK
ncbi:MAG: tetratricopeptide repeat protein [Planctomycetaceae bacterium]|jgi:tetratricopeptide (TPR) repeat protein|nr:tetratricopeptide repeat protein [Planctomycetaceae bacterium]MBT6156073.1 tetratricopeptide repeat protein [Planctomycetaceae bacterium]MBT6485264.1 tetratricopeptide repeat protein [Planctomycetaceae bacterium]MBT6498243.1 tetratricopeptide repeat protein [Planctomycetaceae bacterium]